MSAEAPQPMPQRLMSLDTFRGMTIAGMLLVNNPGSWDHVYWPLLHAEWNGWTFTDLIFPFFLFIVGVAMVFSFNKRLEAGESRRHLFGHVVRRAVVLYLLGLFSLPFVPDTSRGFFPALATVGLWGNVARWATVWSFLCAIVLITGTKRPLRWIAGYAAGALLVLVGCCLAPVDDPMKISGLGSLGLRVGLDLLILGALVLIDLPGARPLGLAGLAAGVVLTLLGVSGAAAPDPIWRWLTDRRLTGVLPRIGVCYLIASAIYFLTPAPRNLAAWIVVLLAVYWVWMLSIPIPGFGMPDLSRGFPTLETPRDQLFSNWCFYIDYHVLGSHTWGVRQLHDPQTGELIWSFDPEGVLSTVSAIGSVLFGVLTGLWLRRRETTPVEKTNGMFVWGCGLCVLGLVMSIWFPINKRIWSSSYTVFMAGMALLCLAMCHHLIDVRGLRRWAQPFVWFGMNAIAAFFFSGQMAVMLGRLKVQTVTAEGAVAFVSWHRWIYDALLTVASPVNASLLFAIGFVLVWTAIVGVLCRLRIFLKI